MELKLAFLFFPGPKIPPEELTALTKAFLRIVRIFIPAAKASYYMTLGGVIGKDSKMKGRHASDVSIYEHTCLQSR